MKKVDFWYSYRNKRFTDAQIVWQIVVSDAVQILAAHIKSRSRARVANLAFLKFANARAEHHIPKSSEFTISFLEILRLSVEPF